MNKGLFITFEGIDGCGKSTQLARARAFLEARGVRCVATREPGGTEIGERIRELLLAPAHAEMSDECELLLYFAARAQHVRETIIPAMETGAVVLCDRFDDATFAYQGFGRGLSLEVLGPLNAFATGTLVPARTFVFDICVQTAAQRLKKTGKAIDRMEGNGAGFHEKVRRGYLSLAKLHPHRIVVLEATKSVEQLSQIVCDGILELLV
jgi:dTMP kinase